MSLSQSLLAAVATSSFSVSIIFCVGGFLCKSSWFLVLLSCAACYCSCSSDSWFGFSVSQLSFCLLFLCKRFKQGWPRVSRECCLRLVRSRHGVSVVYSACAVSHFAIKWNHLSLDKLRLRPLMPTLSAPCVAVNEKFAGLPS